MNYHMAYGITIEEWTRARLVEFYVSHGNFPESAQRQVDLDLAQLRSYWESQRVVQPRKVMQH